MIWILGISTGLISLLIININNSGISGGINLTDYQPIIRESKETINPLFSRIKKIHGKKISEDIIYYSGEKGEITFNLFYSIKLSLFKTERNQFYYINIRPFFNEKVQEILNKI